MTLQITCVNKKRSPTPFGQITRVGGIDGGVRWSRGISQVIHLIEAGQESYFMQRLGFEIPVTIVTNEMGYRSIQAILPFDNTNQLMSLPECIL